MRLQMGHLLRCVSCLLALSFVLVEPVLAQPASEAAATGEGSASREADEARQRFREASVAAESGHWEQALGMYQSAYARYPHATTLYNIGYCHAQLGHPARALYYTTRALDPVAFAADRRLADERRAEALALQRLLLERVSAVTVSVDPVHPFTLRVDGVRLVFTGTPGGGFVPDPEGVAASDPVFTERVTMHLDPGSHAFVLTSEGKSYVRSLDLVAGQVVSMPWSVHSAPVAPKGPAAAAASADPDPPAATPDPVPEPAGESSIYRPLAIGSFVVGGAGLGVALVSGILALKTHNQLEDACPDGECDEAESHEVDRYRTAARLTNVGLWTGLAGGALGVGFLLLDGADKPQQLSVVVAPSRIELRGAF